MAVDRDVARWMDKLAIQELIVKYCDAATRGDWDLFESLFTPDAVYEVIPTTGAHVYGGERSTSVGAREIRESSEAAVGQLDLFLQVTLGSVVTLAGDDHATATTPIHALTSRSGAQDYMHYGIYYDEVVKVDGAWKFTHRVLQPLYYELEPLPGQTAIARKNLR